MKKRFFAAMLAAAVMALFLLPQASFAAGESGIQLGTGGLKKDDEVYFGEFHTSYFFNWPWIVLDANGFLFSKYVLGMTSFNDLNDVYSGSLLHGAMSMYYNDMFTPAEKAAIKDTTLPGASMDPTASDLTGQKLFPLSIGEVAALGWGSDILKAPYITLPSGLIIPWWTRTTAINQGLFFHIDTNGDSASTSSILLYYVNGHRPALNLDLGAVLFMSPAVDGKASGAVGPAALNANLSPSSSSKNTWKLTLLDNKAGSGRENFAVSTRSVSVGTAGGDVSVAYAAAKAGANEYLSALLVDSANNVLYYGRLSSLAGGGSSGTQDITIPALPAGSYTLKIFNEQCNGDYKSDYASAFQNVALTVSDQVPPTSPAPPTPIPTAEPSIPQTGDTALPGLWIGLALLAGVTLTASLMLRGEKRG